METITSRLLIPYDEARHLLGDIGRTLLYDLVDNGDLERVNIGRRGFITAKSLAEYVDSLSRQAATAESGHADNPDMEAAAQQQVRAGFAGTKVLAQQRD